MEEVQPEENKQLCRSRLPQSLIQRQRPHPWLVITHGYDGQRQTFCDISEGRYYTRIIPELHDKYIRECHNGWFAVKDESSDDCFLLNSVTMEKVQLPPLLDSSTTFYETCIMSSSSPHDPDCQVIFYCGWHNYVLTCKPGDKSFVKQELVIEIEIDDDEDNYGGFFCHNTVLLQGKIYAVQMPPYECRLLVADLTEPAHFNEVLMELDSESLLLMGYTTLHLVESCGEILLVKNNSLGDGNTELLDFEVFRADFSKRAWVRMTSIGQRAIFLNAHQGFSCSTAGLGGVRQNSIYFRYARDRNIYVFDLEDQSISMSLPCPIVSSRQSTFSVLS